MVCKGVAAAAAALLLADGASAIVAHPAPRILLQARPFPTPSMSAVESGTAADSLSGASAVAELQNNRRFKVVTAAMDNLFKIQPVYRMARDKARSMIVDRADLLGVGWFERVGELERSMDQLQEHYSALYSPAVDAATPDYYRSPFHAYPEGNLCWQAAMEVEPSAISVHANIYTPAGEYEADGDEKLRSNFLARARELLTEAQATPPKTVVDLGCSTGLSTFALARTFPGAHVTGVDLSPHMLAVARHQLSLGTGAAAEADKETRDKIEYLYAAAESVPLPTASYDLVSMCLVAHELPQGPTKEILREARRLLKPGGAFAFMDMDPVSTRFKKMAGNPMAFAGFKSTEPWLLEYITLDFRAALEEAGFDRIGVRSNSPGHRTVVAFAS